MYAHKVVMQVTTPLLFKLIPAVVRLGVLLRWFSPDIPNEVIKIDLSILIFSHRITCLNFCGVIIEF